MSKEIKTAEEYINETYGKDWTNPVIDWFYGDVIEAMEDYATIRLKAQEEKSKEEKHNSESQKLYEWMLSDKREPAQTHFSSGVIRNIAKEIEFREEKHKDEMEKFAKWLDKDLWVIGVDDGLWYGHNPEKGYTFPELIEMFKKSITANG
jgi:hypothetical protein